MRRQDVTAAALRHVYYIMIVMYNDINIKNYIYIYYIYIYIYIYIIIYNLCIIIINKHNYFNCTYIFAGHSQIHSRKEGLSLMLPAVYLLNFYVV